MKSYINSLADYHDAPVAWEYMLTCPQEHIDSQMRHLTRPYKRTETPDRVERGDVVVLALESEKEKFNRPSVYVTVGGGIFDRELEEQLLGRGIGECFEGGVEGAAVKVTVQKASRTVFPEPDDEMAAAYAREHEEFSACTTVESYRQQVEKNYQEEKRREAFFGVMSSLAEYVLTHSDWEFDEEELHSIEDWMWGEMERGLTEMGKSLEQMTAEELRGYFGAETVEGIRKEIRNQAEWQIATALWLAHENGLDASKLSLEELEGAGWEFLEQYVQEHLKFR